MKLSEVTKGFEGKLLYDGEFETLEYCTCDLKRPFLSFMENQKFISKISEYTCCIFCKEELVPFLPPFVKGVYVTDYPKELFHTVHNNLCDNEEYAYSSFNNIIGIQCEISEFAHIAKRNVIIGDNVIIEDNVTIKENVVIGNDCIIHSGAVIGGKAFTFARASQNRILGLRDVGKIVIGNRVEIFPMVHIAKGILPTDVTSIGDDVKIDAFAYIGHGTQIDSRTLIAAGAVIGGNARIGQDSWIGINATVSNRVSIGNNVRVSLGAVATKNVGDNKTVTGNFAIEHSIFLKNLKKSIMDEVE